MAREHTLDKKKIHFSWDKNHPPAIEIESGDTVHCETAEVTNNQVTDGCPASKLGQIDFSQLYPLAGPIYVKGSEPGDMLEVEILRLQPLRWGWAGILPGLGLLSEDFKQPYIRHFDLTDGFSTALREDIRIPLQPFCGTMGVATDDEGPLAVLPPTKGGGNIDTRHLGAGAKLYLPVYLPGALFSAGDCHAAQGDGEITVNAIETANTATLQFILHKGKTLKEPRAESPTHYITFGLDPALDKAMRMAMIETVDFLEEKQGYDFFHAYTLSSIAVDFRVTQVVDKTLGIHGMIPKKLFVKDSNPYWYRPH